MSHCTARKVRNTLRICYLERFDPTGIKAITTVMNTENLFSNCPNFHQRGVLRGLFCRHVVEGVIIVPVERLINNVIKIECYVAVHPVFRIFLNGAYEGNIGIVKFRRSFKIQNIRRQDDILCFVQSAIIRLQTKEINQDIGCIANRQCVNKLIRLPGNIEFCGIIGSKIPGSKKTEARQDGLIPEN